MSAMTVTELLSFFKTKKEKRENKGLWTAIKNNPSNKRLTMVWSILAGIICLTLLMGGNLIISALAYGFTTLISVLLLMGYLKKKTRKKIYKYSKRYGKWIDIFTTAFSLWVGIAVGPTIGISTGYMCFLLTGVISTMMWLDDLGES